MHIIHTLKTIRQEFGNYTSDRIAKSPVSLLVEETRILNSIKTRGFYVIQNFYSAEDSTRAREEIDLLIEKYRAQIFTDGESSDHRIFGADRLSPLIKSFYDYPMINRVVQAHERTSNISGLTMAARLEYKPGNKGSGGGWHRDWAVDKQIKAMLYLSDVNEQTGPFQYIEGSHRHLEVIADCSKGGFEFNQTRFTDEAIDNLMKKKRPELLHTLAGRAGTLILVNTRGIHRGMPIKAGTRHAFTNYYWSNMPIPEHVAKMMIAP